MKTLRRQIIVDNTLQIWMLFRRPTIVKSLGYTATTFGKSSIANMLTKPQNFATSSFYCEQNRIRCCTCNTLITLTMVVGTNIKTFVFASFVPFNMTIFGIFFNWISTGKIFFLFLQGIKQPTPWNNSVGFQ